MKITLCGSVKSAKKMVQLYGELKKLGHDPIMHEEMFGIADGTAKELISGIAANHAQVKKENNFIKWWYNCIRNSDAILVCNVTQKGIANYIGGNTFLEIGFAHVHDKKIFLLNRIPEEVPYVDEIKAMVDVVIEGDLRKITF